LLDNLSRFLAMALLLSMSAMFSGLTLGLCGLDTTQLEVGVAATIPTRSVCSRVVPLVERTPRRYGQMTCELTCSCRCCVREGADFVQGRR
jgi:hypothetical protein